MKRVLIISHDKVGPNMAGPGMRYHQIALELVKKFDVTLATLNPSYLDGLQGVPYKFTDIKTFDYQGTFDKFDVIFALWLSEDMIAYAKSRGILLIFDLYAPVPVEDLVGRVHAQKTKPEDDYNYRASLRNYELFFQTGDYFVCSNPIQKDFWLGYAFASGATSPSTYQNFPIYDRIALLPMGTNLDEIKNRSATRDAVRASFPAIGKNDFVAIWTGGIWDWFDATTPIKAIAKLRDQGHTNVHLVFFGVRHPNKDVPEMAEARNAIRIAKELGVLDKQVFLLEGWTPYEKRLDYLLSSDVAIYAHKPSIEARYSHRTRVLDHILALLPTIATRGDYLGGLLADKGMGIEVDPENPDLMASTLLCLRDDTALYDSMRQTIKERRSEFTWTRSVEPLVSFIDSGVQPRTQTITAFSLTRKSRMRVPRRLKAMVPRSIKEKIKRHIA